MSILRTNSLALQGEYIIIKVDTPIIPAETVIFGYFIHSDEIFDTFSILIGEYSIILSSQLTSTTIITNWKPLKRIDVNSPADSDFLLDCNNQIEPYYIYFKLTKPNSVGIINIEKISLQIANKQNEDGSYGDYSKYPLYSKSIFGYNNALYSEENMNWAFNVLAKIKGFGFLPTYIKKDRDFDIFWGWITHIYSIIVNFARQFLNVTSNKELFTEFLRQKGYFKNSKTSIYETLTSTQNGKFLPIQYEGYAYSISQRYYSNKNWITTGRIETKQNSRYILSIVPNIDNLNGDSYQIIDSIDYFILDASENLTAQGTLNFNINNLKKTLFVTDPNAVFLVFSYKKAKNCLIDFCYYGENFYKTKNNSKDELLEVYNIFKQRGNSKDTKDLISNVLESSPSDNLICQYIPKDNYPWILGKSSPMNKTLTEPINISELQINESVTLENGKYYKFVENKFLLNEYTSLKIKNEESIKSCLISFLFYDEEGNNVKDVLFSDLLNNKVYTSNSGKIIIENIPSSNIVKDIKIPLNLVRDIRLLNHSEYFNSSKVTTHDFCILTYKNNRKIKFIQVESILVSPYDSPISLNKEGIGNSQNEYNFIKNFLVGINLFGISSGDGWYIYSFSANIIAPNDGIVELEFKNTINSNIISASVIIPFEEINKGLFYIETIIGKFLFSLPNTNVSISYTFEGLGGQILHNALNEFNLNFSVNLNRLPYNLYFANPPKYYLVYGENNSNSSNTKIQSIISQKILPYSNFNLFLVNSELKVKEIAFQVKKIELSPSLVYNTKTGTINVSWYGGIGPYTLKLYSIIDSIYTLITSVSTSSTNYLFKDLNGMYKLVLTDFEGLKIIKDNIPLRAPNDITCDFNIVRYPGLLSEIQGLNALSIYNKVFISVRGGILPYKITYAKSPMYSVVGSLTIIKKDSNTLLKGLYYPINTSPLSIFVEDASGVSRTFFPPKDSKLYIDLSQIGDGSCELFT